MNIWVARKTVEDSQTVNRLMGLFTEVGFARRALENLLKDKDFYADVREHEVQYSCFKYAEGIKFIALVNQKLIDPHFFKDCKYAAPIARFLPTEDGWKMAQTFVTAMRFVEEENP